MGARTVSAFWLFQAMLLGASMLSCIWTRLWFLWAYTRSEVAGSCDSSVSSVFHFWRLCQTIFHHGCTVLHPGCYSCPCQNSLWFSAWGIFDIVGAGFVELWGRSSGAVVASQRWGWLVESWFSVWAPIAMISSCLSESSVESAARTTAKQNFKLR